MLDEGHVLRPPGWAAGVSAGRRAALCARPAAGETTLPLLAPQRRPAPGDVSGERPNPNPFPWCSIWKCTEPDFTTPTGLMNPISLISAVSLSLSGVSLPLSGLSPASGLSLALSPSLVSLLHFLVSLSLVSLPLTGVSRVSLSPPLSFSGL